MKSTHWWILGAIALAVAAWYFLIYAPPSSYEAGEDSGRSDPNLLLVDATAVSIQSGVLAGYGGTDLSAYSGVDKNGIPTNLGA